MNTVKVENCKTLFIGRRGENEVTEVVFDFSEWQTEFGNGVIDLFVKRNGDSAAYPVVLSVDGTVATWIVTDADTAVVGSGKIEFVYTVDQKVAKSAIFPFYVGEDIGQASSEPPDPYESWIETLTELGTETQANAQAAAQSASDAADSAASASESAGQAEDSAEDAEAWAVGERNGEPVSVGDETYENNAKYWAEKAKTDAPVTSVNGKTGDIVLDLDDIPNGETFARSTPEQLAQIGTNADDIADIDAMIPNTTSESNHLVNVSFLTNRLTSYRTSAAQDTIDAGKQEKITAYGILKRDRSGNITAAIAGTDYLTADALNGYRKASAQDAIDNAQNDNINNNTAAINTMQPAATAADIGKALIVKTVADGKPTSYEYGEAGGGGGSALTAGDGIDITEDVISNTQGIEYIVGTQAASTASWKGNSTDETLKVGKIIAYYLPFAGSSSSNATLTLTMGNGAQTAAIPLRRTGTSAVTNQFAAGNVIILIYDGTYWRVSAYYDQNDNTVPSGYCLSPAATAAKAATCSYGYRGDTNYFPCLFRFANTAADATLAITTYAPEAAPIYVNGARTSATNTFSAGVILFLYYNGAYYCYNDGRFPILVDGTVTSVQEYAAGLLADYRTAAAQDTIDAGKQAKITATGILKGDGAGGVSAAVAGTDYITGLEILSYGNSAWADFLAAYTANKVVYCRASSNSNPASGSQTRMAFMAYVNDAANPTNVEFQYYRSVQTHSDSQQGDQVFIYKLDKTAGWTVTTRNTFTAIDAGNGLDKAYANGKLTLGVNSDYRTAADQDTIDNAQDERIDGLEQTTTATTVGPVAIATFEASTADMPLKGLTVNIEPVQAAGTPSPENPLPITGWTGCNILQYPENLLRINDIRTGRITSDGGFNIDTTTRCATLVFIPVAQNTNYTIATNSGIQCIAVHYYENDQTWLYCDAISGQITAFTTPANCSYIRVMFAKDNTSASITPSDITTAILMSGNAYNITFPTEAGTVYGGTLDLVGKKLLVDTACIKSTWGAGTNGTQLGNFVRRRFTFDNGKRIDGSRIAECRCNVTDRIIPDGYTGQYTHVTAINNYPYISVILPSETDDSTPIEFFSPIIVLDNYDIINDNAIVTLHGENNIWANCGDVTVTYGAYLVTVKAYADKVGDSILSAIAPLEMNYTASRAYATGSFLFVGTKFYKVTATISSGDTITPDTNVTQTTVAEQLMALANA